MNIGRNFGEHSLEISAGKFPFEGFGDRFVPLLEVHDLSLKRRQIGTFIGHQRLSLQNGKVDLNLVEPTGMDRRMNQNRVWIPTPQAIDGRCAAMGRTIVRHPEDTSRRAVRLLAHYQIHYTMKRFDPRGRFAAAKQLRPLNIPGRNIRQRTTAFVLMFDSSQPVGGGRRALYAAMAGLDACFFITTDHEIARF